MQGLNFEDFRTYLRVAHNKNKATTEAITRDVKNYLDNNKTSEPDSKKLLDIKNLETFVVLMTDDKQYKATTRAEKLRRIKLAIKFIMRQEESPELYYRAKRVIDEIDEWCHGLGKQIALQRQEYALVLRKELPEIIDPNEFMEHDKVHKQIYTYTHVRCLLHS